MRRLVAERSLGWTGADTLTVAALAVAALTGRGGPFLAGFLFGAYGTVHRLGRGVADGSLHIVGESERPVPSPVIGTAVGGNGNGRPGH